MSNRRFLVVFLLAGLLVAGVGSYYASRHPDGLNRVAHQAGFADQQKTSAASDGPFAGYSTQGIDDDRVSRGVAGLSGALLVLTIGSGLFWMLRRRGRDEVEPGRPPERTGGLTG